MKNFLNNILDWIYKKKCYFCGDSRESLKMCSKCYEELTFLDTKSNRTIEGVKIYSAGCYEQNLQKLIRGLKYHNQRELAFFQAKFMYDYWSIIVDKKEIYQIVPVPQFKAREKSRKYNHMNLVAEEFSKLTGYETNFELIERIKDTKPQYKLSKAQRMQNLENAFQINQKNIKKLPIMLIDDICTTGSTFENMIIALRRNGLTDITCFSTTTPFEIG